MIQKEAIHLNVSLDGERKPESFRGTAKLFAFNCAARGAPSWAAERFKCKRQLVPKPDAPVAAEQGPQTTTHAKTAQKHPEAAPGDSWHGQGSKTRQTPL